MLYKLLSLCQKKVPSLQIFVEGGAGLIFFFFLSLFLEVIQSLKTTRTASLALPKIRSPFDSTARTPLAFVVITSQNDNHGKLGVFFTLLRTIKYTADLKQKF